MSSTPSLRPSRFRIRMVAGAFALIPIVVTVAVLRFLFGISSSILRPFVNPATEALPPAAQAILSFIGLLIVVYVLGELATNFIGRRILAIGESVVLRVPIVKTIYSASKQVVSAFEQRESRAFKSVVFVEFPSPGSKALGFVTGELTDARGAPMNTVFIPTSPNPTTGFLQVIPKSDLMSTSYTVEEGLKMVMSVGVLIPKRDAAPF